MGDGEVDSWPVHIRPPEGSREVGKDELLIFGALSGPQKGLRGVWMARLLSVFCANRLARFQPEHRPCGRGVGDEVLLAAGQ